MSELRIYGVSFGNGNDGVSQLFPSYYVKTDDPWKLAQAAMLAEFKEGKGQAWANEHMDVDGEAEYTISATLLDPPCEDTEDGEYPTNWVCDGCGAVVSGEKPEQCDDAECESRDFSEQEYEDAEDGRNWSDSNGAWMICEVFPCDDPREGTPSYDSLEEALSADVLALASRRD